MLCYSPQSTRVVRVDIIKKLLQLLTSIAHSELVFDEVASSRHIHRSKVHFVFEQLEKNGLLNQVTIKLQLLFLRVKSYTSDVNLTLGTSSIISAMITSSWNATAYSKYIRSLMSLYRKIYCTLMMNDVRTT